MKKLICILLIFMFSFSCFAEIDFSKYSVDELYSIIEQANDAIVENKGLKSFNCPIGEYTAGIDFPAGRYLVTIEPVYIFGNESYAYAWIIIFDSNNTKKYSEHIATMNSCSCIVSLDKGDTLKIEDWYVVFTPYTGLVFN